GPLAAIARFRFCLGKLYPFVALSNAKPLRTFAGNALLPTHCPTQNRFALLLEMLSFQRIVQHKTASHFCWKCSPSNALSNAKPRRTFAGNASASRQDMPDREIGLHTRDSRQHREDLAVDRLEIGSIGNVYAQQVVGAPGQQIALADLGMLAHHRLEAPEILVRLALQRDLDDHGDAL